MFGSTLIDGPRVYILQKGGGYFNQYILSCIFALSIPGTEQVDIRNVQNVQDIP